MERVNVTRIEHENVESAVRENARSLQRLERKVDDLAKEIVALQKAIRALTPLS
jgi:prefoldin subunit 5